MSTFCLLTDTRQYQNLAREIKELHPEMSDSIIKFFIASTLEDMYDKKINFEDNELQKNGLPTLKQVEESIKIDNIAKEKEDELFNNGVNFNRNIKTEFEAIVKLAEDLKRRNPYFSLREFNQKYGTNIGMRRDTGELVYRNPKVRGLTVYNPEDTKLQTRKRIERKKLLTYLSDKFNLNIEELDATKFNANAGKTTNAFVANSTVYVRNGGKESLDNTILIEEFLHPLVHQIYINNKDLSNKLLDQARKEFPELAKQIKVLYTGKSAVSQDEELITQVLSKYLNREIEIYGENNRKLIDYINQFIKEIIDLCKDLFSDVNIQKGATITLSGKDIRDVFSFENLAQLINSKEVKFNDTLNGIRRESRSEESNEIDILEEREKLKTLNSIKAIKSVGSKKKFIELLKKANISNGIIDVFSKAYDEIPAIKELSPINALNLISQSRYTDIAKDYQKHILEPINEKLEAHLQSILNKYKIEVNVGDAINKFGDIFGVFDVYNKIVYLSKNRNKITMPEEFSHAFVKLMGTKISKAEENKDFTFLFKNVENTSIYKDVYNKYKDIYKNQDGTPNINKIKEEAIGQALSVAIVNKFEDHQDKSFIQKVFEWFENIINSFKNAEYLDFNSLIYKIADEIINNDLSRLNKVDSSKYTLLDYVETLKSQTEKDGGKAMEFLKFFSKEMRNIITGSLSYRFQGTVYRGALDAVHDIDMVVPLSSHGINMNSTIINNAIKAAQNRNPEELAELLWDTEYFKKVKEKYPKMVQTSTYPSGDYLVLSTVYSEDESLSKRFKAMNGSYASRLDRFTLEERGKIYLFDFFLLDNDNTNYVEDPNNKINLAGFKQSFEAKFDMGRAKDIFDYQMWETFDEFKDFYVPRVESDGLFYQVKQNEFEFYSGGAIGSDKAWASEAKKNGLNIKDYTTKDYDNLSGQWKDKIEKQYVGAATFLGRPKLEKSTVQGKLVRRDMMQADKADAIFAIAQKIVKPGEKDGRYVNKTNHDNVSGGTAYAIARGIQRNIPIYVFDQSENSWKTWNGNSFVKTDEPNITKRAALIGTREINESGNAAIRSVFNKLVGQNNDVANSNSQIEAAQPELNSNNTRFANLSKEQKDVIKSVYGEFITIQGGISVDDYDVVTKNCPNEYFKELFSFMLSDAPVSRDAIKWLISNTNKNDLDKIKILTGNKSDLQTDNTQVASNERKTETPQILQKPGKDPMPLNTKNLDEYKNMDFKSSTEREDRVMMLFSYISDRIQMSIDDQETPVKNRKKFIINNISKILYDIKQEFQEVVDLGPTQMKDSAMYRAFTQLNNNWKILLEEAAPLLKLTEGIAIETTTLNAEEYKSEIENEDSFVYEEVMASESGDTSVKDGWMIKARSVDPRETLSENTRRILATIIRRLPDGSIDYDDIGLPRTLNPDYAHIKILEAVSKCNGVEDFIPTLRNIVNRNPWMQGVVDLVCDGIDADGNKISPFKLSVIQSQFYSDMYKEFMPYWIQKDGKTKQINRNPGIYYILNSIRDNFESGSQLTKYYKIYNKDSSINIDECDKLVHSLQTVLVEFKNQPTPSDKVEYAKSKVSDIVSFLNAVGIDAEEQDILDIINSEKISNSDIVNNINIVLTNISTIANSLKSGEFNPDTSEKDYVSFYGKAFSSIAEVLNILPEGATMASFREAGKSYYAYSNYGYLGKLIKNIHNWQEQWVEKEFRQYRQFYNKETGEFRLDWLKWLNNSSKSRDLFERKIVLHKDRVEFNDWSPSDYMQVMLTEYFSTMSNKNEGALKSAWYYVPLLADAPSCEFIKFIRYAKEGNRGVDEVIVDKLVETALLEYERIKNIQQRAKIKGIEKIKYYDIDGNKPNGAEFKFFPELNNYYIKEDAINRAGDEIDFVYGKKSDDYISVVEAIDRIINKNDGSSKILLNRILTEIEKNAFSNFLNSDEVQSIAKDKDGKVIWGEETLKDYFYNSVHAYTQIVQLTTSDLAWYKDLNDFQKRFKQVYGQTARLNTHSQFGKEKQTVLFLKDEERKSMIYKEVEDILNNALNSGRITQADKKYILSTYDKINVTDAQGFRSLKSYRSILDMQGLWTERHEEIYQNLQNKDYKFKKSDFDFLLQTIKPFMYTQIGVESHTGYGKLKMPMQNKNSEAVLLSILVGLNTPEKDNSKLSAIAKFMDEHDIDLVQYDSGIKVGCFGSINLNGLNTEKEILDELNSRVFVGNKINDEVVHVIDFEDYGIQVATPEHLFDAEALKGSQFQKLILGDLPSDFSITVNGKLYNRNGFAREYQDNLAQNIIAGLYELKQIFKDNKTLSEALIKEMAGSARYTEEQKRAVMLNENGDFEIPLFDPTISVIIQNITNSLIKKKTTKQKIKGGKCTQKSAVGYDEELNVRFFDTNGHIIITRKEFNELYIDDIDFYDDNQRKFYIDVKNKFKSYDDYRNSVIAERVAYWEAYMPIYSKSLIDVLGYDSKGNINIRNLPSELRNIIGYRIPTEQHYSMQPIRIKGFLPMAEGSEIILPADITNTTGSDYDIDGVYLMIPEFDIIENYDKAREELKKDKFNFIKKLNNTIADNKNKLDVSLSEKYIEDIIDEIENGNDFKEETTSNKIAAAIKKAYCEASKIEFEDKYSKFNQQASDEEKARGIKARNNKMIDMSFGVLTSKHMANRTIKSGNFNNLSRLGYIMEILSNSDYKSIAENLGIDKSDVSKVMNTLINLSKDEAQKIATKVVKKKDPTNPLTQIYFHDQNSVGGRQIGIYASVSPVHSMGQYHDTHLIHPISILGKSYSRFDIPGIGISDVLAEFLAASVDNVKDPVLAKLNQNGFTGNITTCLVRLGVPVDFIVTILNQPIVKEITKSQLANPNADPVVTISEAIKKYKPDSESPIERKLTMVDMMKCISFNNKANFNADSKFITEFNSLQYAAGMLFSDIYGISKSLSRLTKNSRYDTSNNAAGPKIADDIKKIIDIETVAEEQADLRSKLDEAESYRLSGDEANAEKIMQRISKNAILTDLLSFEEIANGKISSNKNDSEFLHVATVAGIVSTKMFLRKFFPHFNNNIISMIRTIVGMSDSDTISTNLIDSFVEDFIYYKLRESNTFSSIKGANTILEQTNYFINKFPDDFVKFVENHPELSSNRFIQMIKKQNRGKYKSIDKLKVQNVGSLSKEQKDKMSKDWTMLLINNDEEVRSMAIKLFVYQSLFSLSYVPDGFVQQAPNILREVTPDYMTLLNSLMKNNIEYDYNFVLQFSLNNIFSNQIGHIIEGDDAALFSGKDIVNVNEDFLNVAKFNFDDYQLVKIKNNNKVESAYILMLGEDGNYFYKKLNIIRESKNEPRQYYPGISIEQMPEIIDRTLKSKQDDDDTSDRAGNEYGDDGSNRKNSTNVNSFNEAIAIPFATGENKYIDDNKELFDDKGDLVCG